MNPYKLFKILHLGLPGDNPADLLLKSHDEYPAIASSLLHDVGVGSSLEHVSINRKTSDDPLDRNGTAATAVAGNVRIIAEANPGGVGRSFDV